MVRIKTGHYTGVCNGVEFVIKKAGPKDWRLYFGPIGQGFQLSSPNKKGLLNYLDQFGAY